MVTPQAWDPAWDKVFTEQGWKKYPTEELVVFVSRRFGQSPDRKEVRLLELGCGPGANVWFLAREGYAASGIDGSEVAVRRAVDFLARERLEADLRVGDLVRLPYPDVHFDGVFDIASIQHNLAGHREAMVREAWRVLRPGGALFAMMLGTGSWGDGTGTRMEAGTYKAVQEGPAGYGGLVHFFAEDEFRGLFKQFSDVTYERSERTWLSRSKKIIYWMITAVK